ncbi:MAG: polysaccharide deacetylase family protein [Betaproteobacteria bacterium]
MIGRALRRVAAALAAALLPLALAAQTIVFSFDDGFDPRAQPNAAALNAQMLKALADAQARAILFPVGKRVDSPPGLALVRAWSDAGHAIGNHSYSHLNLGSTKVSATQFCDDVLAAQRVLAGFGGWTPRLRFPYLKEGDTAAKRDAVRAWMRAQGYRPGPVGIDASDWYYDERFVAWRRAHPQGDLTAWRAAYLDHLRDRARYYDALAQATLGRRPPLVLLLHTNEINATFLPDVLAMFRAEGWRIVDAEAAFADPLYEMQPNTLPAGESIVWALAKQAGRSDLRYPAEDDVYEKPILDRLGL